MSTHLIYESHTALCIKHSNQSQGKWKQTRLIALTQQVYTESLILKSHPKQAFNS